MSSTKAQVILLHGLGRTTWSMRRMESALRQHGFSVINLGYPSLRFSIEQLSDYLGDRLAQLSLSAPIHFVTHSLGGILLRYFLAHNVLSGLGRVVMLSPPNQGSELAQFLRDRLNTLYRFIGSAGQQLGTTPDSLPNRLGFVQFELGVITGCIPPSRLTRLIFSGANDGKVAVKRAQVEGMKDLLIVPSCHRAIMNQPEAIAQVIHFLETGSFAH